MKLKTTIRPLIVTDDHLDYLDALRESGVTNMYGASSYLREEFLMNKEAATEVLSYWMATFPRKVAK